MKGPEILNLLYVMAYKQRSIVEQYNREVELQAARIAAAAEVETLIPMFTTSQLTGCVEEQLTAGDAISMEEPLPARLFPPLRAADSPRSSIFSAIDDEDEDEDVDLQKVPQQGSTGLKEGEAEQQQQQQQSTTEASISCPLPLQPLDGMEGILSGSSTNGESGVSNDSGVNNGDSGVNNGDSGVSIKRPKKAKGVLRGLISKVRRSFSSSSSSSSSSRSGSRATVTSSLPSDSHI
jgi:hypothetical protein